MMATELSEREEALWLQQPNLIAVSDNLFVCIPCTNFSVSCLSGAARQSILYRYATGQVYPGKARFRLWCVLWWILKCQLIRLT